MFHKHESELEFSGSHIKQWACLLASVVLGLGVGRVGDRRTPGAPLGSVRLCSKDTTATNNNKGGDHNRIIHGIRCHFC